MTSFSSAIVAAIIAAYDFSSIERIVDVAGGHGMLISAILKANPQMKGILFDQPAVIEKAGALLEAEGVANRCEMVAGDFFESVPGGGDAYIMKHIIHDWETNALKHPEELPSRDGSDDRVLLIGWSSAGNAPGPGKFLDLEMLLFTGGCERTEKNTPPSSSALLPADAHSPTQSPYSVTRPCESKWLFRGLRGANDGFARMFRSVSRVQTGCATVRWAARCREALRTI